MVSRILIAGGHCAGARCHVRYQPPAITYTNGSHVAEVEVDPENGHVRITRYVVVHDCGHMINPMMVEGQVHGGVVHGIGMTLFEHMRYDTDGQPLTVTFADYLLPTSDVVPPIEIHHMESPTPSTRSESKAGRKRHHRCAAGNRVGYRRRVASAQGSVKGIAGDAGAVACGDQRGALDVNAQYD